MIGILITLTVFIGMSARTATSRPVPSCFAYIELAARNESSRARTFAWRVGLGLASPLLGTFWGNWVAYGMASAASVTAARVCGHPVGELRMCEPPGLCGQRLSAIADKNGWNA